MDTHDDLYKKLLETDTFFLIAGPCVIEEEILMMNIAEKLKKITSERNIPLIFKSSFVKANRTSVQSYTGPGMAKGLRILQKIKEQFEIPILTDVHESSEVRAVAEIVDIIQIPAFLCRQTNLISAAAKTGKIINLKKGQFLAPEDMSKQLEKVIVHNNYKVMFTERGTTFGYHNLVVDFRSFPLMKIAKYPVIYDVSHSLQKPSIGNTTGGTPEFAPMMAQAAMATGYVDGLFLETHPNPEEALSDANTQIPLDLMPYLLDRCQAVKTVVNSFR
ncbi:MAG: 3-deoxy-8-phosphooctulonate synthase [Candidatus Cloacimonetes bacterium]|nr:3-deoxy-8-phosphooctulonate synthase [Candidatus Cloacimonadota bacterium]